MSLWDKVVYYQKLDIELIKIVLNYSTETTYKFGFSDCIRGWKRMYKKQKIPEDLFIKPWYYLKEICEYQDISESFIEKYCTKKKKLWIYISEFQVLSRDFVLKYIDKISFAFLSKNKKNKVNLGFYPRYFGTNEITR